MNIKLPKFNAIFLVGLLTPIALIAEQNIADPEVPEVIVIKVPINDQKVEVDGEVVLHVCKFDTTDKQLAQMKDEDLYELCDQEQNNAEQFIISDIQVTEDQQLPEPIKKAIASWKPEELKCNAICQNTLAFNLQSNAWSIYAQYGAYGRGIYGYGYVRPYGVPYGRPYYNSNGRYYNYRQPYVYPTYPRYYYYNGNNHYRYYPRSGIPRSYRGNNYYYYNRRF